MTKSLENPLIIDDALPDFMFTRLQQIALGNKMDWYVTITNELDERPSFANQLILDYDNARNEFFRICAFTCGDHLKLDPSSLTRIRFGLIQKAHQPRIHAAHVDQDYPHITGLLYLNDSDGYTYFWEDGAGTKELQRIAPKPNRLVLFDGSTPHSSSTPENNELRYTMNLNFRV